MPLYEYRCEKCGKNFEVRQKFSDAPLETHDECGGKVERLISVPSLQFKGSGFYVNDYARGSSPKPEHKSSETKSDSKNDSKSSETKSHDTKSGESKSGDSKSGESKSGETKSESKPSGDSKS